LPRRLIVYKAHCTFGCALLCLAAYAPVAFAQQANAVLAGLGEKRAQIAREEQAAREACYAKFASSSCLKEAARSAQDKRASLRQEENAARRALREDRAAKQRARVQEKTSQSVPQPAPVEKKPPLVQPKVPGNATSAPSVKRPPLQGDLSAEQAAANEAAHAKRLADAKAKQEEIKKKQAERAAKKAQQTPPASAGKL
jgi:colicin import membrane protein